MTTTTTILKAMQAVLLVTVLTPATVFAGSLSHPVSQTQDQPTSGEAKHINRGLILTPAEAAPGTPVAPQVEIPPLPPRHDEAPADSAANTNFSTAAAPAATSSTAQTSSIVTLPAAAQPATDATPASVTNTTSDVATTSSPVAPAATPAAIPAQTPVTAASPAARPAVANASAATVATTTPVNSASTKTAQVSHQSRSRHHKDDSFNIGGFNISSGNIERQATKFFNRRDVRSVLTQFGLN